MFIACVLRSFKIVTMYENVHHISNAMNIKRNIACLRGHKDRARTF